MHTFLIKTSPKQAILPAMADLMIGVEDRLTVLEADSTEALASCVRNQAFSTVRQAFGSDRRLNIILFREFEPASGVPKDINDLMLDVMAQESAFVQEAVGIIKNICDQEQAKLDVLTFLFGERCSHGQMKTETRDTIANSPESINLIKELPNLEDPTRLQLYFKVCYAYIDMDRLPRNEVVRSDWYFYFQLMTCVCLAVQGTAFPLRTERQNPILDGASFRKAFPLPEFKREVAANMISRKINLLQREVKYIQEGKYNVAPEEASKEEKNGSHSLASLPDRKPAPAEEFTSRPFCTWERNRASALANLEKLRKDNAENLGEVDNFQKEIAASCVSEQLRYKVAQLYRKAAVQSGEVEKQAKQTQGEIKAMVPPLRTFRAAAMALGTCWTLYFLLRPFGLSLYPGPIGVLTVCLLVGICVYTPVRNARLFSELRQTVDAYKSVWSPVEGQMRSLTEEALKEQDAQKASADKELTSLRERQAEWHRSRLNRLIGSLRQIANNVGLDLTNAYTPGKEEKSRLNIAKGVQENSAVYGFSADEYKELYMPGGKNE